MKQHWVGLLDCNNFFVSCERLFRPDLKNVPVAVLSSNDGCIVARSQEVKDIQVPMGVPYFQVRDILKTHNVVLFSGNHQLYKAISKRVFSAMRATHADIEQYSVDEAFFYFYGTEAEVQKITEAIKAAVEQQVGVPVSLGVSTSKTLAKVANNLAKKTTGVRVMNEAEWKTLQSEYLLASVWGIGRRLSQSLREAGLLTVAEYLKADPAWVKSRYGVVGLRLQEELRGVSVLVDRVKKPKQSIMSSRSFGSETADIRVLKEAVLYHVEQVAYELRQMGYCAGVLQVFISPSRHGDFVLQGKAAERIFEVPLSSTGGLAKSAIALLEGIYTEQVPYKKAGVRVSHLQPKEVAQLALFGTPIHEREDKLQVAIDAVNSRFKSGRIHQGFLEGKRVYTPKSELKSPAYVSRWDQLAVVKA